MRRHALALFRGATVCVCHAAGGFRVSDPRVVGVYAPAGYVPNPAALERARERLASPGYPVKIDPSCHARAQRFAGSDDERLGAVMRMVDDDEIGTVMA